MSEVAIENASFSGGQPYYLLNIAYDFEVKRLPLIFSPDKHENPIVFEEGRVFRPA